MHTQAFAISNQRFTIQLLAGGQRKKDYAITFFGHMQSCKERD